MRNYWLKTVAALVSAAAMTGTSALANPAMMAARPAAKEQPAATATPNAVTMPSAITPVTAAERRMIFIERDVDPTVTADRLATARNFASQVGTDGQIAQVVETHLISEGRPASVVDATNVRFQESLPPPTLPATTVGIGGGQ